MIFLNDFKMILWFNSWFKMFICPVSENFNSWFKMLIFSPILLSVFPPWNLNPNQNTDRRRQRLIKHYPCFIGLKRLCIVYATIPLLLQLNSTLSGTFFIQPIEASFDKRKCWIEEAKSFLRTTMVFLIKCCPLQSLCFQDRAKIPYQSSTYFERNLQHWSPKVLTTDFSVCDFWTVFWTKLGKEFKEIIRP